MRTFCALLIVLAASCVHAQQIATPSSLDLTLNPGFISVVRDALPVVVGPISTDRTQLHVREDAEGAIRFAAKTPGELIVALSTNMLLLSRTDERLKELGDASPRIHVADITACRRQVEDALEEARAPLHMRSCEPSTASTPNASGATHAPSALEAPLQSPVGVAAHTGPPRIFITDKVSRVTTGTPGLFGTYSVSSGEAHVAPAATQQLMKRCPDALIITTDAPTADYLLDAGSNPAPSQLINRAGTVVYVTPTHMMSTAATAAKDVCHYLETHRVP